MKYNCKTCYIWFNTKDCNIPCKRCPRGITFPTKPINQKQDLRNQMEFDEKKQTLIELKKKWEQ